MATFQVGKDTETPDRAGAGGFQIDTLIDEHGNDITDQIDVGVIFQNDDQLKDYLSNTFGIPQADIDIDDL